MPYSCIALPLIPEELTMGRKAQPVTLRAPEIVLGHAWSTPVDIWTLGCMVRVSSSLLHTIFKGFLFFFCTLGLRVPRRGRSHSKPGGT